jgi:methionine synthase / methylenetetrahydrofolate reductase(NADPH)
MAFIVAAGRVASDGPTERTMTDLIAALRTGPVLADGAMGSYIFRRTGRLSEHNHVYEALNEDNPELIEEIHLAYLRAGARCLTTNTFGANGSVLRSLGEEREAARLTRAGVRVARRAIERYRRMEEGDAALYLLGSVGPSLAQDGRSDAAEDYAEQIEALLDEGVDAVLLETFRSLDPIRRLLRLCASRFGSGTPLIVDLAFQRDSEYASWNVSPEDFVRLAVDSGVTVAGINCCAPWDALAFLDELDRIDEDLRKRILISVMPNAGGFQRIGNRYMTRVNPEFMGGLARTLARRGVRLIGGCCEVHPLHIREMHNYLHGHSAHGRTVVEVRDDDERQPSGDDEKRLNGPFSRKLKNGAFVVSVETLPPRGTSPQVLNGKIGMVEALADSGLVDAVDITDGSRGIPLMPVSDFVSVVRERLGWTPKTGDRLEIIPHFTCRDLNMMGMQARLVGFHAQRIHNVLFITGDPPKMSPTYPRSTAVFDADSVAMIRLAHGCLNAGVDFGGQPLARSGDPRTHFTIGSGFEPEALDLNIEMEKLRKKIDAGVDYIMTQPAFRPEPLGALDPVRPRVPILAGVLVLTSLDHAHRMSQVPGMVVPEPLLRRFARFESSADQARLGVEIAVEQIRRVRRDGWAGLYLMSPASSVRTLEILREGLEN